LITARYYQSHPYRAKRIDESVVDGAASV